MRRNVITLYKTPKNMGVAPRYDQWMDKHEPWEHMKRMGRLVGTGFYIPPEWYSHFRMFPPINHNFQQEKTLNPRNNPDPTSSGTNTLSSDRVAIRQELAHRSRLLASEGMRYYNLFWVRKPLDRMEKQYMDLTRKGAQHSYAMKRVLDSFYDEITVKRRVAAIQEEEAKLSGKFISMREAIAVMAILSHVQREQLSPHQAAVLAKVQKQRSHNEMPVRATLTHKATQEEYDGSPEGLGDILSQDDSPIVQLSDSDSDSLQKLRDVATDGTGEPDWYSGMTPVLDLTEDVISKTG